jgi:hypothetical protein
MAKTKTKDARVAGAGNFEQYQAMLGKRLSNAATPHKDARTKRARTRGASLQRALRYEMT